MRKTLLFALGFFLVTSAIAQNRMLDWPMQLKRCSIDIKCDVLTATTFIEMEFFNPNSVEIEGVYRFKLAPNQVVTAFQLDLHGKFRDGSIEEKWKASNAYNTVVGKRIDPALLTMDNPGNYTLRIYPIAPNSSRKVTMTIQQVLKTAGNKLLYELPLSYEMKVGDVIVNAKVNSEELPLTRWGLINMRNFQGTAGNFELNYRAQDILMNMPVAFEIPFRDQTVFCTKSEAGKNFFVLFHNSSIPSDYKIDPRRLTIFWDASATALNRNIKTEISFLEKFMERHSVEEITIVTFNHEIIDRVTFNINRNENETWKKYINRIEYKGATQLGCIDLKKYGGDLFILFSDGRNTYGDPIPRTGTSILHAVHSDPFPNYSNLHAAVGSSGGKVIDLHRLSPSQAVEINGKAENWLIGITTNNGRLSITQTLPLKLDQPININGTYEGDPDTIYLHYGNNNRVIEIERIIVSKMRNCGEIAPERFNMLASFESKIKSGNWMDMLDFGLDWKIVTPNTAYLVLERIEDYKRFNISPPKELEDECEKIDYVWKDTRRYRSRPDEFGMLNQVVGSFNTQLSTLGFNDYISLDRLQFAASQQQFLYGSTMSMPGNTAIQPMAFNGESQLSEVVVTSAFGMKRAQRTTAFSAQQITSEHLQIIPETNIVDALAGKVAGIQVRGESGAKLDSYGSLRIRGGLSLADVAPIYVVNGTIVDARDVNTHDIEDVTVLKGANATALFGERAKGGAIVINMKKRARPYYSNYDPVYKLENMPDVEYIELMNKTSPEDKFDTYEMLKKQYGTDAGFYIDMADHFYEHGLNKDAFEILMEVTETWGGSWNVGQAIAYVFEKWKMFDEAIKMYRQLIALNPDDPTYVRNLAWAQYRKGDVQESIKTMYNGIKSEGYDLKLKTIMLTELNAMIAIHRSNIDISFIPASIIRPMTADLRIVVDGATWGMSGLKVNEPYGVATSTKKRSGTTRGVITSTYWNWGSGMAYEYYAGKAEPGNYKLKVNYNRYYNYSPSMIRVMIFRNFGRPNQSIEVKNVIMENQYGEVEIDKFKID